MDPNADNQKTRGSNEGNERRVLIKLKLKYKNKKEQDQKGGKSKVATKRAEQSANKRTKYKIKNADCKTQNPTRTMRHERRQGRNMNIRRHGQTHEWTLAETMNGQGVQGIHRLNTQTNDQTRYR